jgi:hypothetical protein
MREEPTAPYMTGNTVGKLNENRPEYRVSGPIRRHSVQICKPVRAGPLVIVDEGDIGANASLDGHVARMRQPAKRLHEVRKPQLTTKRLDNVDRGSSRIIVDDDDLEGRRLDLLRQRGQQTREALWPRERANAYTRDRRGVSVGGQSEGPEDAVAMSTADRTGGCNGATVGRLS